LAKKEYLMRHDKVCTHLHYSICKALGIETTDKWYTHVPKPVCEDGNVTVLWNQAVHTDREVTANRPDIIIKNKKEENMNTDRCGNTRRQKCCAKGSGKEATGIVTRSLKTNLETVPGKHSIDSLQKTAILGTSHIIRKVLQCEA